MYVCASCVAKHGLQYSGPGTTGTGDCEVCGLASHERPAGDITLGWVAELVRPLGEHGFPSVMEQIAMLRLRLTLEIDCTTCGERVRHHEWAMWSFLHPQSFDQDVRRLVVHIVTGLPHSCGGTLVARWFELDQDAPPVPSIHAEVL